MPAFDTRSYLFISIIDNWNKNKSSQFEHTKRERKRNNANRSKVFHLNSRHDCVTEARVVSCVVLGFLECMCMSLHHYSHVPPLLSSTIEHYYSFTPVQLIQFSFIFNQSRETQWIYETIHSHRLVHCRRWQQWWFCASFSSWVYWSIRWWWSTVRMESIGKMKRCVYSIDFSTMEIITKTNHCWIWFWSIPFMYILSYW